MLWELIDCDSLAKQLAGKNTTVSEKGNVTEEKEGLNQNKILDLCCWPDIISATKRRIPFEDYAVHVGKYEILTQF
jgi:hypothetical protein